MRRAALLALVALAAPALVSAAVAWHGGGAPPGLRLAAIVAEPGGTISRSTRRMPMSSPRRRPRPFRPTGGQAPVETSIYAFQVVTGGLRVIDRAGELGASSDDGRTWTFGAVVTDTDDPIGRPFDESGVLDVALDPHAPDRLVRVHADGGVQRSTDGAVSWVSAAPLDAPGTPGDFDRRAPGSVIFTPTGDVMALLGNRLWRSHDVGETWQRLPNAPAGRLVPSPVTPDVLWIAGRTGVFRTENGGSSWVRTHAGELAVVPSPTNSLVAWAAGAHHVDLTLDGGHSWRRLGGAPSWPGPQAATPLPGRPSSLCIAAAQGLWCSDGGRFAFDDARLAGSAASPTAFAADPS